MAEQEIIKHTKKIFKAIGKENVTIWHKLKEFAIEIIIIVIAISLSIWFHNYSEHRKEQKLGKRVFNRNKRRFNGRYC